MAYDKFTIGDWSLAASTDDDGHLTVEITHADKSDVCEIDEDLSNGIPGHMARFTTEKIEKTYRDSDKF